jgi:hypothetical protein
MSYKSRTRKPLPVTEILQELLTVTPLASEIRRSDIASLWLLDNGNPTPCHYCQRETWEHGEAASMFTVQPGYGLIVLCPTCGERWVNASFEGQELMFEKLSKFLVEVL